MTLVVCVDDKMGIAFNGRRQSRDEAVCIDTVNLSRESTLWVKNGSASLFDGLEANIAVFENIGEIVDKDVVIFCDAYAAEFSPENASRIILYRWNRRYPADVYFCLPAGFTLMETIEFPGKSHEKITREVYAREIE